VTSAGRRIECDLVVMGVGIEPAVDVTPGSCIEVENGIHWATSAGDQNTGILKTLLRSNGIAVLPKEKTVLAAGEEVAVHLLRSDVGMMEE
jgi:molybdopterin biosynthesis enzyme